MQNNSDEGTAQSADDNDLYADAFAELDGNAEDDATLLAGDDGDDDDDHSALAAVAGETEGDDGDKTVDGASTDLAENKAADDDKTISNDETQSTAKPRENMVPAGRVQAVIDEINRYAERAGVEPPDFGEAVDLAQSDFSDLTTQRDRWRIKAAAAAVDADAPAAAKKEDAAPAFDFDAKEDEAAEAFFAGDKDRALEIRREINAEIRRQAEEAATRRAADLVRAERTRNDLHSVATQAVAAYPFLNDNNGDNAAMREVLEWREFYESKGEPPAHALAKAVSKVAPQFATRQQQKADQVPEPKKDERKAAAIARNTADGKAQPPAMDAGVGNRAAPPLPEVSSQEDWEKLPESERERLLA